MGSLDIQPKRYGRIIAIDPRARRVAHVYIKDGRLIECEQKPFRFGTRRARANESVAPYLKALLERCQPHAVLVPQVGRDGSRNRGWFAATVIRSITKQAVASGCAVHVLSRRTVKAVCSLRSGQAIRNSDDLFRACVERFPDLVSCVPQPRGRIWEPEQYFVPLLNAAAMYMAFEDLLADRDQRA